MPIDELYKVETSAFVPGETLIRYFAMGEFEVDGITYHPPMWYAGGMLKLYPDDEMDIEGDYADGEYEGELIVIEPGDAYESNRNMVNA